MAQAHALDIVARADTLILSTFHGETGDAEVSAFRLLTTCSGSRCAVTERLSGSVDTIELVNTPLRQGAAAAIGSKHGITPMSESSSHTGEDLASLGAWLEHSAIAVLSVSQAGEEGRIDVLYGITLGELAGALPGKPPGRCRDLARSHGGSARSRGDAASGSWATRS